MTTFHFGDISRRGLIASALLASLVGCGGSDEDPPKLTAAAVSSPDQFGAQAAKQILDQGGNAVDAGVAVAFALAVTLPSAGNIGGGGFMTIYMDGKPYFVDYREKAPGAATPTMYLDANGDVIPRLSLDGSLAFLADRSSPVLAIVDVGRQEVVRRTEPFGHFIRSKRG